MFSLLYAFMELKLNIVCFIIAVLCTNGTLSKAEGFVPQIGLNLSFDSKAYLKNYR